MKKRKPKAKRTPRTDWQYFGFTIWRNTEPGSRLRYTAGRFAADTLAGMRELIREHVKGTA